LTPCARGGLRNRGDGTKNGLSAPNKERVAFMAQGSGFDNVLLIDDRTAWLYTGCTRAAKRLTIARHTQMEPGMNRHERRKQRHSHGFDWYKKLDDGDDYFVNLRGVIQLILTGERTPVTVPLAKLIRGVAACFEKHWLIGHLEEPIAPYIDGSGVVMKSLPHFAVAPSNLRMPRRR